MTIEKTRLQSSIMMAISNSDKQFQKLNFRKLQKSQNLIEMNTVITMLRGYCNSYDAVKLLYFSTFVYL